MPFAPGMKRSIAGATSVKPRARTDALSTRTLSVSTVTTLESPRRATPPAIDTRDSDDVRICAPKRSARPPRSVD